MLRFFGVIRQITKLILLSFILNGQRIKIDGACLFPPEYVGDYVMQKSINAGNAVDYSTLNISLGGTPLWGNCHERNGNNFIFMTSYGETCMRCLHFKLRSKNILQVLALSQETLSKCYITEELAKATCPTEESARSRSAVEIILFKKRDIQNYPIPKEYCPTGERYRVTYSTNNLSNVECMNYSASMSTCPSSSSLNFRFPNCPAGEEDVKFECLGHWDGPNGQKYLALEDSRKKPAYRCGLYKKNPVTNVINIALSRDSTCDTDLHGATRGYETMILTPNDAYQWPTEVQNARCSFPEWMQGEWEHVTVENNSMVYKDHNNFKTYNLKCLAAYTSKDKYLVFSRTQCDEKRYNCIWIQKRSTNVLEFQLGTNPDPHHSDPTVCSPINNFSDAWITQGRLNPIKDLTCPISGVYTGVIPETKYTCSRLSSDCTAPDLMYYKVFDCNTQQVYEEREYKCLGHWREGELLYTYTQRHDDIAVGVYECFVGSIVSDKEDYIIIKEAGEHCQRNTEALLSGMKLTKQQPKVSCSEQDSTTSNESNNMSWAGPTTNHPTKNSDPEVTSRTSNRESNSSGKANIRKPLDAFSCLISFIVINYLYFYRN